MHKRAWKAQAAMEYLVTYGWAIMAIMIVLAALFALGIFNTNSLGPRAQPGSCQVYRSSILPPSLGGQCDGTLPLYVGSFTYTYVQLATEENSIAYNYPFTVSAWISRGTIPPNFIDNIFGNAINNGVTNGKGLQFYTDRYNSNDGYLCVTIGASGSTQQICASGITVPLGSFSQVAVTYDGVGNFLFYMDGTQYAGGSTTIQFSPNNNDGGSDPTDAAIAARGYPDYWSSFRGQISNVQVYNASLPASDINSLYQEGIGGPPIDLNYLTGWWMLNGNVNDSSGNRLSGTTPLGINYTSSWTSNYTPA